MSQSITDTIQLPEDDPLELAQDQLCEPRIRNRSARELMLAIVAAMFLAVAMTWPILRHPTRTIPQDTYDPTFFAWQLAWDGRALKSRPFDIWNTNAIFPEHLSLAFSDSLLGYAPFGLVGSGPEAAVLRYNLLFVLSFAMATLGIYVLVRQLGAARVAAAVAAVAFAYSPWRFAHAGHLNILSTGGIPLALAMLARGHGWSLRAGYSSTAVRPWWALAGWLTAAWQISLGFALGIPFAYVIAGTATVVAIGWLYRGRRPLPGGLLRADLAGGAFFLGITALMVLPYLTVLAEHPDARRSAAWLDLFSPPIRGFFIAAEHSWLWGTAEKAPREGLFFAPEMAILPGFALIVLAVLGLFISSWGLRVRALLAAAVAGTVWLAMGTAGPGHGRYGYLLMYRFLPGFDGTRTPGRLVLWTTLLLCVLAAGTLTALERSRARSPRLTTLVLTLSLLAVTAEGINRTPHPEVPTTPIALSTLTAPVLVLPTDELTDLHVMLWSTDAFPQVWNGSSSYNSPDRAALRTLMTKFPDPQSVNVLRALGVRTVVVLPEAAGTAYDSALRSPGTGLEVKRSELNGATIFTL